MVRGLVSSFIVAEPYESGVLKFSDAVYFFLCRFLPFSHGSGDVFSIYHAAMDVFSESGLVSSYGAHGVWFPSCRGSQSFESSGIGVDVQVLHGEFHELVISCLFSGVVLPGRLERSFKVVPKGFV